MTEKEYPEREWDWAIGHDAKQMAIGTFNREAAQEYNQLSQVQMLPICGAEKP